MPKAFDGETRALWVSPDDIWTGLEHGRHYRLRKKTFKNGKVNVFVEETGSSMTFDDEENYSKHFKED